MREWRAKIEIAWVDGLPAVAGSLARAIPDATQRTLSIVPSSLRHDDRICAAIRGVLREREIRSVVVTPRAPAALFAHRRASSWRRAAIDGASWRIDARLAAPWIAIALVDRGRHTGPFSLDLPARFLHPADRVRLAVQPDRLRRLADIAAIAPPETCLVLTPADGGWLVVTTRDPIAAELWALGLSERFHPSDVEMQGPWEEPTVQRATELGLGIRIPGDLQIDAHVPSRASLARSLLFGTAERLGLSKDAIDTTD